MIGKNHRKNAIPPSKNIWIIAMSECKRNGAIQTPNMKSPITIADFPKMPLPRLMSVAIPFALANIGDSSIWHLGMGALTPQLKQLAVRGTNLCALEGRYENPFIRPRMEMGLQQDYAVPILLPYALREKFFHFPNMV
jgi:hypothetical protein